MSKEIQPSKDMILSSLGCAYHIPTASLLLADLHIGYEATLEGEGFSMPRFQTRLMMSKLESAIDHFDPSVVIINGDIKHNFDRNLSAEWRDVELVVDSITSRTKLLLIRGNHDNYLATILSKRNLQLKKEIVIGNLRISHGHEMLAPWDEGMVFGHEHPAISLRESTGANVKIPCFLYNKTLNRLVLPAFSPLAIGSDVIKSPDSERMIPLLASTGIDEYAAYGFNEEEILNYRKISDLRAIGDI
ncbi:MAG: metallophosphoesterase [Thermoplasmata archaeon]|nr:metallophosphoesterase [Thermoplasmata archaeon]